MSYHVITDPIHQSVVQDGMRIDWDVPIRMRDGVVLRADVFRPNDEGKYPALLTYGPYGKNLHFKDGYPDRWEILVNEFPEVLEGTTGKYMNWETSDPEKWIPDGYAIVRIDSRGAGRSEGYLDCMSEDETQDFYECIEFFAQQSWCTGDIGLNGISYYGINQWTVAALNPPHLKAICPFEGCNDVYRDNMRHGGIFSDFRASWYPLGVLSYQHGLGNRGKVSPMNGQLVSGPETLSDEELQANRADPSIDPKSVKVITDDIKHMMPDLSKITVPVLSCGNWGGNALHLRGNIEGYKRVSSKEKWLELHGREHFTEFYTNYGVGMQKRFFNHFLKGQDTWHQPPVFLNIKHVDGTFTQRAEQEWPIARTQWVNYYLDVTTGAFDTELKHMGRAVYQAEETSLSFFTKPLEQEMELTGPAAAKIFLSSTTKDADVFLIFRVLDPSGEDVTTIAASDAEGNLGTGWLRASQRKLDAGKSTFEQPWHSHDCEEFLTPGEIYELNVEIWPICMTIPAGYRFGFSVSGRDFSLPKNGVKVPRQPNPLKIRTARGHSIYTHSIEYLSDAEKVYSGETTLYSDEEHQSYIMLPIVK